MAIDLSYTINHGGQASPSLALIEALSRDHYISPIDNFALLFILRNPATKSRILLGTRYSILCKTRGRKLRDRDRGGSQAKAKKEMDVENLAKSTMAHDRTASNSAFQFQEILICEYEFIIIPLVQGFPVQFFNYN
jgi:hypothetical protein